jgi:DNA-binding HxlR family transcriptional regulator
MNALHTCETQNTLAIRDTLDVVGGKRKLPIVHVLKFSGHLRFNELQRQLDGITSRMLSKELKEMELNQLVRRQVYDTVPVTIMYEATEHADSLCPLIESLMSWGLTHRIFF